VKRSSSTVATFAAAGAALVAASASAAPDYAEHVVSLSITQQGWDQRRPWAKLQPNPVVASAVVVEGPLLLTRAQMIADATLIEVEKRGDADLAAARVVHVDPEIDLALLAVDEPGFFDDLEGVEIAEAAPVVGDVESVRWEKRQLEVSTSRVSRIEVRSSRYGSIDHAFLLLRSDLESGGWSEPVFRKGELIGLTTSQQSQYASAIPAEILSAYVRAARQPERYAGFASLGIVWQNNRDEALASYLSLPGAPRGVLIRDVRPNSSAAGVLRARDILLELDGFAIDAIGNYEHPRYGRLNLAHLPLDGHRPGDVLRARVWREGREIETSLTLQRYSAEARLIPWRRENFAPAYLVAGGLVFRELDGDYLRAWGPNWSGSAPGELVFRYHLDAHNQTQPGDRIVILSHVLADAYNIGYHDAGEFVVETVNDRPIRSIAALAEAFERPVTGFHTVTFAPNGSLRELVLDAEHFESASAQIAEAYGVPFRARLAPEPSGVARGAPAAVSSMPPAAAGEGGN
jgi:S1-C subfamily serine protease